MLESLDANATLAETIDFVIDYSLGETIEIMTDLISAHHIIYGSYHATQDSLESDFEQWEEVLSVKGGVKEYIMSELSSPAYSYNYGDLNLVGFTQKIYTRKENALLIDTLTTNMGKMPPLYKAFRG